MLRPGRFQIEAAVQSAHAARRLTGVTDWVAIARLYDGLYALTDSPVVAVNRAIAVANSESPAAGLSLLAAVERAGGLERFAAFWAAKADLCLRTGDVEEAARAYTLAIGLEIDPAARGFLLARRAALG
jgi:RNA polymerase sigma-70 factor (ECF subfamily)